MQSKAFDSRSRSNEPVRLAFYPLDMRILSRGHTWFRAPGPCWTRGSGESEGSNIYCTNTTPTSGGYIRSIRRSFNKPVTGRTFNSGEKTSGILTICIGKPEIPVGKSNESSALFLLLQSFRKYGL